MTLGEDGSWVSMAVGAFFLRRNIGLERERPLLLLPTLVLKNLINGGGYLSARPGLDMGFAGSFIFPPMLVSGSREMKIEEDIVVTHLGFYF